VTCANAQEGGAILEVLEPGHRDGAHELDARCQLELAGKLMPNRTHLDRIFTPALSPQQRSLLAK